MILSDHDALELVRLLRRLSARAQREFPEGAAEAGVWADALHDDVAGRFMNMVAVDVAPITCVICGREATLYQQHITTAAGLWLAQETYQHEKGACSSSQMMGPDGRVVPTKDLIAAARLMLPGFDPRRPYEPHTVVPGRCDRAADCHMRLRGCGCPPADSA